MFKVQLSCPGTGHKLPGHVPGCSYATAYLYLIFSLVLQLVSCITSKNHVQWACAYERVREIKLEDVGLSGLWCTIPRQQQQARLASSR